MFPKSKRAPAAPKSYDKTTQVPVLRSSICTGERTVGFQDRATGAFSQMTLVRTDADLQAFLRAYGIAPEELKREW